MKKHIAIGILMLSTAGISLGAPDNNAVSAGTTQPHSRGGLTYDGAFGNPALVGLNTRPRTSLTLIPTSVALWSDKLSPPLSRELIINPIDFRRSIALYLTLLFESSFGVNELLAPEKVSEILTEELRDGIGLYAGVQTSPFVYATRGFALNLRSYANIDVHIPGAFLLPFFSETEGIIAGNAMDISDLRVQGMLASELAFKLGWTINVPAMRNLFGFDKGAAGLGIKLIFGHAYFNADVEKGSVFSYDSVTNRYRVDATADIISAGTGIHGNYHYDHKLLWEKPISGQGWSFDLGTAFHNNNHLFAVDVQDLGVIFWDGSQIHRETITLNRELDIVDMMGAFEDIFELDSLKPAGRGMATWQPASLNVGYSYHYSLAGTEAEVFLSYISAGANYRQQLILGPGRNTYMPRLAAGATVGLLAGYLPIRYGIICGGSELLASSVGVGLDAKFVSVDLSYKTIGSPFLTATYGFEAAAGLTFRWGFRPPRKYESIREEAPPPVEVEEPSVVEEDPPLPELGEFPDPVPIYEPIEVEEEVHISVEVILTMLEPTVEETEQFDASQRAINFRTGGTELSQGSLGALNEIAEFLKRYPEIRYEIQGHTDFQGGDMYNLRLSSERAAAVKRYLVARGVSEDNLVAIGYGRNKPIADNNTAIGRALNRRVAFERIISDDLYERLRSLESELMRGMQR